MRNYILITIPLLFFCASCNNSVSRDVYNDLALEKSILQDELNEVKQERDELQERVEELQNEIDECRSYLSDCEDRIMLNF